MQRLSPNVCFPRDGQALLQISRQMDIVSPEVWDILILYNNMGRFCIGLQN